MGCKVTEESAAWTTPERYGTRTVVQEAHDHDGVGVNVQAQLAGLLLFARGLIRANFGGIGLLFRGIGGGCSALGARPPATHVICKITAGESQIFVHPTDPLTTTEFIL